MERRPLGTRIEDLRADFQSLVGKPFEHFYCPILHVDEGVDLTKGHIVPESLGGKSKVLQRRDVDTRFGSFFEAEAADAVLHGLDANPFETIVRGNLEKIGKLRRFKTKLRLERTGNMIDLSIGVANGIPRFFPKSEEIFNVSMGNLEEPTVFHAQLAVELDARSSILATSLRTNHLCWFRKCGYRYAFSNEGIFVAWVLREFYRRFIEPRFGPKKSKKGSLTSDQVKSEVDEFCFKFANFIRPWPQSAFNSFPQSLQNGSLDSNLFIVLLDNKQIYGRISIVKFGSQHIAVMTPIITDARGWALFDLAEDLKLEFSIGMWNAEAGVFEVGPPAGHTLIWPSATGRRTFTNPLSIRQAAEIVIRSGRMAVAPQPGLA